MTSVAKSELTSRRIGGATSVLIGLGIVLVAATAYLFINLRDRQEAVLESVREDAMWAVFQTHREASRLVEAILVAQRAGTPQALDDINLKFDLVYSRIVLLDAGFFSERFSESRSLDDLAAALQNEVRQMAARIDGRNNYAADLGVFLQTLLQDARALQKQGNDLVIATNEVLGAARVQNRTRTSQDYGRLAQIVAITALVFLGTIALQFIQLRLIARNQRHMRDLSIRNAQSAKAAQAATEAKSMFLATMSHEIRTPLNGIIGAVDLLEETELDAEQARRALTIRRSGHILLDVINDILDFSNLDVNGATYHIAPVSLPQLADILRDVFGQRLKDAGLDLTIEVPSKMVSTDDVRLRQVLINLIGNAIKFTPSGTIKARASIQHDDQLRFEVEDSGIGISDEDQQKLFKDFSQIEGSASRRFGGTGLGLAISKRIIEGLGGQIGVKSTAGQGSTFWLEIPVEVLGEAAEVQPQVDTTKTAGNMKYNCRILLVEDNTTNQEIAKALLEGFGVTVTTANDGQAALDCLEAGTYDLVIMDIQMPVMDGLTATRSLRDRGFAVPVVGLSANAFSEDRLEGLDAGMTEFLAKPVSRAKIASLLERFAEREDAAPDDLIDLGQMEQVLEEVGETLFLELLSYLNDDAKNLLSHFSVGKHANEGSDLDAQLHSLKGAASSLGLAGIAMQAQTIRNIEQTDMSAISELAASLERSIDRAAAVVTSKSVPS